ncbi:hypothetical protein HRR80_000956 [Exophiala dermatitidis]|uniref:Uncharacterized protein n=1 Tax=Exophiala dermatitidis TaxID=5970 RepID=A0AAN6IYL3_EXODE|nr:hypothetical protein HRR80_000956 [Exophiala dermatitidis]
MEFGSGYKIDRAKSGGFGAEIGSGTISSRSLTSSTASIRQISSLVSRSDLLTSNPKHSSKPSTGTARQYLPWTYHHGSLKTLQCRSISALPVVGEGVGEPHRRRSLHGAEFTASFPTGFPFQLSIQATGML